MDQALVWFGCERFEALKPTELHDTSCEATTTKTKKRKKILSPKKIRQQLKGMLFSRKQNLAIFFFSRIFVFYVHPLVERGLSHTATGV